MKRRTISLTGMPRIKIAAIVSLGMTLLLGCALITPYDPTSYKNATDLKAETLALMEKSAEPASGHLAEIDGLKLRLRQAYEYEVGKGKPNEITVKQWSLLLNPGGHLAGGFLKKWQGQTSGFSPAYVTEKSEQVGKAFDEIIKLENYKVKN